MENKLKIQNFTDLEAWKVSHRLAIDVYQATKKFPKEELFGIVSQLRRAAVSVTSNLAEGFSRNSAKDKAQFYAIAKGSLTELESQLLICRDIAYLPVSEHQALEEQIRKANKLINGLIRYLRS